MATKAGKADNRGSEIVCELVGFNRGSIATNYSIGTVSGSGSEYAGIGSLAGTNSGSIVASYSTGSVNGDRSVGGLVGVNFGSRQTT